ncbi:MAG: sigma-54-dependent Fis family transcriptional regulator [Deltaproteobacteria bacterium]|nr:sigma-54-dependent Fis family transcriptional regulator [Deltaproteobacteria bacterium]MBP7290221.1 sigma-54-dependent Fis family transcriptional regulator [Nannocystaceae bacterium]
MGLAADTVLRGASVLIVDDHEAHRTLLANYLGALGCACQTAGGGTEALAKLAATAFDLVLLDLRMDDLDGMEVLKRARDSGYSRDCIMMSAEGTISHAVEAIRLGASDFLVKPFELTQLHDLVRRVLGARAPGATGDRDPRLQWRDRYAPDLIGEATPLREVFLVLERIAHTDCTVLVLGESGTGKELIARALHDASQRANKPFVPVNCGAIPETLIESELFGHAKGAFSGASSSREGRFAVADGGTLFLDEIGEMSLAVQVKFLRVLQEQEYVPVGETRPRKCDVRIVAATNKNLEKMADEGTFREDLFYRLNLIPLHLPPLRERRTDLPLLIRHFLDLQSKRRGSRVTGVNEEAMDAMTRYGWPGNVRELENTIERMTLLHSGNGVLTIADLPPKMQRDARRELIAVTAAELEPAPPAPELRMPEAASSGVRPRSALEDPSATALAAESHDNLPVPLLPPRPRVLASPEDFLLPEEGLDLRRAVESFENNLIDQALARTGGNKNQASMLLGLNRTTLVEKLRKRQRRGDGGTASDPTG